MSSSDHGPLQTYEVIYRSGHVERVQAHQVIWPHKNLLGNIDVLGLGTKAREEEHVLMHGEIDGHWLLVLAVSVEDVLSVRLVTTEEAAS